MKLKLKFLGTDGDIFGEKILMWRAVSPGYAWGKPVTPGSVIRVSEHWFWRKP